MKKISKKVKWNLGFSISSSVDAVVPPFYIIVRSDRNHKDRQTGRRPHGSENPCICHLLSEQAVVEEASLPELSVVGRWVRCSPAAGREVPLFF